MKVLINIIAVALVLFSSLSFSGSGKAIMPSWHAGSGTLKVSAIFFSNITSNTLNVKFTVYGKDGAVLNPTIYGGLINSNTQLAPNSSGFIEIQSPSSFNQGYVIIEWENIEDEDNAVAMVANGYNVGSNNGSTFRSDYAVPINNGMPF